MSARQLKKTLCVIIFLFIFSITGYSEAAINGTIGTRFTLTGSGFGSQKPAVYAEYQKTPGQITKVSVKVESYSDTSITCLWTGVLPAGTYNLFVKPKTKGALPVSMGNFIVKNPSIENVIPNVGSRGDVISIQGDFFSSAKPKVYLEDPVTLKRTNCKVSDFSMDPITGASSLHFIVPKLGFNQDHLVLKNQIGEVVSKYPYQLLASVTGRVTNVNGIAIENVEITGPSASATSDTDGAFTLSSKIGEGQIFVFSRDGYLTSSKIVSVFPGATAYVPVTMMAIAAPNSLNATPGGTVSGLRGASLSAPQDAFVDMVGNPVTGPVEVSLTPYDPALPEEARAYPGELRGLTLTGETVPLKTYGVMDVTVRQGGKTLQVREGKTVNVGLPAPSKGEKPATVQMWRYDPQQALWIQNAVDGTYDVNTDRYLTTIGSGIPLDVLLNCDNPLRPSCIYGMVVDADGNPVSGARITAQSANQNDTVGIYSEMQTGNSGNYCMTVEMGSEVLLTVTAKGSITQRKITADSSLSKDSPPDCSTAKCKQIRTIIIGTSDPGENAANCDLATSNNPFSGTCAKALGEFYACFHPEGECVSNLSFTSDGVSYEVKFSNGSRMTFGEDTSDPFSMEFYGPDSSFNKYCGKMSTSGTTTTIETETGGSFSFTNTKTEDGGMEITCDTGNTFRLTSEQMDVFTGCSVKMGDTESGIECKPAPGSFRAPCTGDWECNEGLQCCGGIFAPTGKQCILSDICDLVCSSNSECGSFGHDFICCSNGFFNQCLQVDYCQ